MASDKPLVTITWNGDGLIEAAYKAFLETNLVAGREFQRRIADVIWDWPTIGAGVDMTKPGLGFGFPPTKRRAGAPVTSPRNIVDTGQLLNSYLGKRITDREYVHSWPVRHALPVHEGSVRARAGKVPVTIPARPWTRRTLAEWSFERAYVALFDVEMARIGNRRERRVTLA